MSVRGVETPLKSQKSGKEWDLNPRLCIFGRLNSNNNSLIIKYIKIRPLGGFASRPGAPAPPEIFGKFNEI